MDENTLTIILIEPQLGQNIGAVARAMLNFGLTDLRIVNPRDGWPNPEALPSLQLLIMSEKVFFAFEVSFIFILSLLTLIYQKIPKLFLYLVKITLIL